LRPFGLGTLKAVLDPERPMRLLEKQTFNVSR
jgi:hypothetical protein